MTLAAGCDRMVSNIIAAVISAAIVGGATGYVSVKVAVAQQMVWNEGMVSRAQQIEQNAQYLRSIDQRLSRIEGKLDDR